MGNRRRKLLRRKFQSLPWNVYGKTSNTKTTQPEQKIAKIIQDNSIMIDRMKKMSATFDEIIVALSEVDWDEFEEEVEEPVVHMKAEPSVEMRIQPYNEPTLIAPEAPNLKKMTKRALLSYAKENDIVVKSSMTKKQILKTIEES